MKRVIRTIFALTLAVMMIASVAINVTATELKTGIGIVDAGALRLRAGASTDTEILDTASRDDAVVIIREVGDWYLVNYNLQIGYMHKDYITFKDKENVKLGYASFDVNSNVRKGPSTSTGIVAQAPKGETCFIIGFNTGWYKVSFNGKIGYVRSDLLTLLEMPYENSGSLGNTYREGDAVTVSNDQPAVAPTEPSAPAETKAPAETEAPAPTETEAPAPTETEAPAPTETEAPAPTETEAPQAPAGNGSLGEKISAYAQQFLGYRYVYGEESPSKGFDCSGLTWYVAKQFGYNIGRTANQQLSVGTYVSRANLQPGDIVLFERTYRSSERATHAGIYIGNGKFIHAANSRVGVVITSLDETYYSSRFICGRRLG